MTDQNRASLPSYECFICFEPMSQDQVLVQVRGIVLHRACMEDDDD